MYDVTKADHVVNFINCLKHTKGKWRGVPFELLSWQDFHFLFLCHIQYFVE